MNYISIDKLEEMGHKHATIEKNIYRKANGWSKVQKKGRGKNTQYLVASLPAELQRQIEEKLSIELSVELSESVQKHLRLSVSDIAEIEKQPLSAEAKARLRMEIKFMRAGLAIMKGELMPDAWEVLFKISTESAVGWKGGKKINFLPRVLKNFKSAVKRFESQGVSSRLPKNMGKRNAQKISKEGEDVLIELLSDWRNQSAYSVANAYKKWAETRDLPAISESSIRGYRKKYEKEILLRTHGEKAFLSQFTKVIHRQKISAPLLLVQSDDNDLDLYFRSGKSNYERVVVIVVIDTYANYPLGYAVGVRQTKELVKQAYRNAAFHVRELTGGFHAWHEIKADRWGVGISGKKTDLHEFYDRQAIYTPPKSGWARSKTIEASFGHTWHNTLRENFSNYCGHNVKANREMNREVFAKTKHPDIEDAPAYVERLITLLRHSEVEKDATESRQQAWLRGWGEMSEDKKRPINEEMALRWWGKKHGHSNELTAHGLRPTLEGISCIFDAPAQEYLNHFGKSFECFYWPNDLSKALFVTEGGKEAVLLSQYEKVPFGVVDSKGKHELIKSRQEEQSEINQTVLDLIAERQERMAHFDAEGWLKSGQWGKEAMKEASRAIIMPTDAPKVLPPKPQSESDPKKSAWDYL